MREGMGLRANAHFDDRQRARMEDRGEVHRCAGGGEGAGMVGCLFLMSAVIM